MTNTIASNEPGPGQADDLGPSLRRADAGDAGKIATLLEHAFAAAQPSASEPHPSAGDIRRLQERGYFLVLDRSDGGLAASIYVEMRRCRGHFNLLAVAPDCQGRGLGRRLVAVAEALCEAEGCTAMDLEIRGTRTELPGWYRSLGYREGGLEATSATFLGAGPGHVITMTKPLPS